MENICSLSICTGCMACSNICPQKAIEVRQDKEGFERPNIIQEKCTDCGLCKKTCPANTPAIKYDPLRIYSGWSMNNKTRMTSSSGGAFIELAKPILKNGGVVFGCILNKELKVEHTYIKSIDELTLLQGSKYVQSHIGDSYKYAKSFLDSGLTVLFSGTPCQIAGLKTFLRKEYSNLYTIDLICHGVPSPLIFEEYKRWQEQQENMFISNMKFREKRSSWIYFQMKIQGFSENDSSRKVIYKSYYDDPYIRGFLRNYFLRPSCYQCQYTTPERTGDYTIADWWGYKTRHIKEWRYKQKGVSLLFINTTKGEKIFNYNSMHLHSETLEEALKTNLSLYKSFPKPESRDMFWIDYSSMTFPQLVDKYMYPENVAFWKKLHSQLPYKGIYIPIIEFLRLENRIRNKLIKTLFNLLK